MSSSEALEVCRVIVTTHHFVHRAWAVETDHNKLSVWFVDNFVSISSDVAYFRLLGSRGFNFYFSIAKFTRPLCVTIWIVNGLAFGAIDSLLVFKSRLIFFQYECYLENVCVHPSFVFVFIRTRFSDFACRFVSSEAIIQFVRVKLFVWILKGWLHDLLRLYNRHLLLRLLELLLRLCFLFFWRDHWFFRLNFSFRLRVRYTLNVFCVLWVQDWHICNW